jgi:hypothetical protein
MNIARRTLAMKSAWALLLGLICFQAPSWAQALWTDEYQIPKTGGRFPYTLNLSTSSSQPRVYAISAYSSGPTLSCPTTLTVPANARTATLYFTVGSGTVNSYVEIFTQDAANAWTTDYYMY